jgi:hypothetical protein
MLIEVPQVMKFDKISSRCQTSLMQFHISGSMEDFSTRLSDNTGKAEWGLGMVFQPIADLVNTRDTVLRCRLACYPEWKLLLGRVVGSRFFKGSSGLGCQWLHKDFTSNCRREGKGLYPTCGQLDHRLGILYASYQDA